MSDVKESYQQQDWAKVIQQGKKLIERDELTENAIKETYLMVGSALKKVIVSMKQLHGTKKACSDFLISLDFTIILAIVIGQRETIEAAGQPLNTI